MPAAQAACRLLASSSPSSRTEALLVNPGNQRHGPWRSEHDPAPLSARHQAKSDLHDSAALQASSSPVRLADLQPDVLQGVLLFMSDKDVAQLKQASSRLRCSILQACQHWAPKVEGWLLADHDSSGLLRRLRDLDPPQLLPCCQQQQSQQQDPPQQLSSTAAVVTFKEALPLELPGGLTSCQEASANSGSYSSSEGQITGQQLQAEAAAATAQPQGPLQLQAAEAAPAGAMLKRLDWRQVWSCIQRAQQGPWQLDVLALTPAVSPHGVLLTFELLLQQQPAPPVQSCFSEQQHTLGWKDSVTVISFVLDRKTIDIMVDANGRVTSPQCDWRQGCIQLQPGQPRLLALEVSYILPVPAWFLHPCTLAAPCPSSGGSSCGAGSCASSISGMALDQRWDSYSSATTSSSASSMSISQSAVLCSAAACERERGDSSSLTSSSLSSSGSLGACTAMTTSSGASTCSGSSNSPCGRPRLSLDLSIGFGSYVIDPRYIDEASPSLKHRGLERIELSGCACWRRSKVHSWLGRLLPGIRGHSNGSSAGTGGSSGGNAGITLPSSSNSAGSCSQAAATAPAACSPGGGHRQGHKPSYVVTLSKAAAWQVPSDTERRFAEGFMFWAVQHKLEQLLDQYGVLPREEQQRGPAQATAAHAMPWASC